MVASIVGPAVQLADVTPLTDGWFNTTYALTFTSTHRDMVLRIAPHPDLRMLTYEKDLMRLEVAVYQHLEAVDCAVPVPDLIGFNFDRDVVPCDFMLVATAYGVPYAKFADAEGQYNTYIEDLGRYIGELRSVTNDWFGLVDGKFRSFSWRTTFVSMLEAVLSDGEAFGVSLPYQELRRLLAQVAPALDEIVIPTLVHWDLWETNVFVAPLSDRLHVTGVIDWERAFWGDPAMESMLPFVDADNPLWRGIGISPECGESADIRRSLYRIYLQLVMIVEDKVRFNGAAHLEKTNRDFLRELETLRKLAA